MEYEFSKEEMRELRKYSPIPVYMLKGTQMLYAKGYPNGKQGFPFCEFYPSDSNSKASVKERALKLEDAVLLEVQFNDLSKPKARRLRLR